MGDGVGVHALAILGDRATAYPDREAWLAARDVGHRVGASDVAKILGIPPHTPWSVWSRKKLRMDARYTKQQLADFARGHKWERRVIEDYAEIAGVEAWPVDNMIVTRSGSPWFAVSPDGFVRDGACIGGVEAKTDRNPRLWGESGTVIERWCDGCEAIVRPDYAIQVYAQIEATDLDFWDIAVALPDGRNPAPEIRWFRFLRDEETQGAMLSKVERWRERYLIGDEEPEPDGSNAAHQALLYRFPGSEAKVMRDATDSEAEAMVELAQVQLLITRKERREAVLKQTIQRAIGDDYGLVMGRAKALWLKVKGRNGGPGHRSLRLYGMDQ